MLPPHLVGEATADLGPRLVALNPTGPIASRSPFRAAAWICLRRSFPHEADMDQLNGVDFERLLRWTGSRFPRRGTAPARTSRVKCRSPEEFAPSGGLPITAGDKQVGTLGSTAKGRGLALVRLDKIEDALAAARR